MTCTCASGTASPVTPAMRSQITRCMSRTTDVLECGLALHSSWLPKVASILPVGTLCMCDASRCGSMLRDNQDCPLR